MSLGGAKKSELWSPDIKNAFRQADGLNCEAFFRTPLEWEPDKLERIWRLRTRAYGLDDAPKALNKTANPSRPEILRIP